MVTNNWGNILEQICTQEGRAAVVKEMAADAGIPKEIVERTFQYYVRQKDYENAYALAQKAGMKQKMRDLERIARQCEEQQEVEELVTEEQEEEAQKILAKYERAGEYGSVELGLKAIDALSVLGRDDDAATVAVYHGLYTRAIEIKEKAKDWKDAAEIAEHAKLYERAAKNYERASEYGKAAESFVAEVAARKEKRETGQNLLVAMISKLGSIYTNEEQDILVRAAGDYMRADWRESAETTLKKVADKRKVYAFFEAQGDFRSAEAYAASVGDKTREQKYKKVDLKINPVREAHEREMARLQQERRKKEEKQQQERHLEAAKEQERRAERQREIAAIKSDLEKKLLPFAGQKASYATRVTVELYDACKESAEIALRAHKVKLPEPSYLASTLEEMFVKRNLLDQEYPKTMQTMNMLYNHIVDNRIRDVDEKTFYKYRKETKRFVGEMGRLAYGSSAGTIALQKLRASRVETNSGQGERDLFARVYESAVWAYREMMSCAVGESVYYYVKRWILAPAILGIGLLGKCSYTDAIVATTADQAVQASVSSQVAPAYVGSRGCSPEMSTKAEPSKTYVVQEVHSAHKQKSTHR